MSTWIVSEHRQEKEEGSLWWNAERVKVPSKVNNILTVILIWKWFVFVHLKIAVSVYTLNTSDS